MYLSIKEISGFHFDYIVIKPYTDNISLIITCGLSNPDDDESATITLNSEQGLIKTFKSIDTAMGFANRIYRQNTVKENIIRFAIQEKEQAYLCDLCGTNHSVSKVQKTIIPVKRQTQTVNFACFSCREDHGLIVVEQGRAGQKVKKELA